jgi:hypothetical protein
MAMLTGLTEGNVGALKQCFSEMKAVNPQAEMKIYEGLPSIDERLSVLEDKVDSIVNKLTLIFGDSVLLNGRFVSVGAFGLAKKE